MTSQRPIFDRRSKKRDARTPQTVANSRNRPLEAPGKHRNRDIKTPITLGRCPTRRRRRLPRPHESARLRKMDPQTGPGPQSPISLNQGERDTPGKPFRVVALLNESRGCLPAHLGYRSVSRVPESCINTRAAGESSPGNRSSGPFLLGQ